MLLFKSILICFLMSLIIMYLEIIKEALQHELPNGFWTGLEPRSRCPPSETWSPPRSIHCPTMRVIIVGAGLAWSLEDGGVTLNIKDPKGAWQGGCL